MSKEGKYIPAAKALADAKFEFGGRRGGGKTEALRLAMIERTIAFPDLTVLWMEQGKYRLEKPVKPVKNDDMVDLYDGHAKE